MGQKRSYKQYSKEFQVSRYLVIDFGTSKSPKSTRKRDGLICPNSSWSIATSNCLVRQLYVTIFPNDLTACRDALCIQSTHSLLFALRLYARALSLLGTTCLRFALHGKQRLNYSGNTGGVSFMVLKKSRSLARYLS